ncbi:MAG: undecaprenyldiphospho-muramoylpentapeptide beta-N-acetylglucosaminyltransferase [Candidatus Xenobiia bacterium LiM19]
MEKRIVFTGGGTGGHIYPGIATAKALKSRIEDLSVLFMGTKRGLEAQLVPQEGFTISFISAKGLSSNPIKALSAMMSVSLGLLQSLKVMMTFKPHLVVGTGGYVSGPVALAASCAGVPVVIFEQNIIPGKTTRFLSRLARKVCVSFSETERYLPREKVVVTGNPVREVILARSRDEGRAALSIAPERRCILVTGASQGARSINEGIINALPSWKDKKWTVIHLTGEKNFEQVKSRTDAILHGAALDYRCLGFLRNVEDAYAACDLAVCRAGATTLAEITARGIPSLLIPYPYSAEAHQEKNAAWLQDNGASVMIPDAEVSEKLSSTITSLVDDEAALSAMAAHCRALGRPDALNDIVKVILDIIGD